ncbi:hypothetical protein C8Q75DRAFT_790077 [Abortiporus biennis]|nr:hypothetical protein C8Q75DRAFT_790077 [Abortiporus biennis]
MYIWKIPTIKNSKKIRLSSGRALFSRTRLKYSMTSPNDTAAFDNGWPYPIYSSETMTLLKSNFQGHATRFPASAAKKGALPILLETITHNFPKNKKATHCIYAWRSRAVTSSTSASWDIGSSDGGESGAGERLSRLLELGKFEDVIVIVYRWYGGVKLGSDRWKCISGVAKDALKLGAFQDRGGDVDKSSSSKKKGKKK